MSDSQRQDNRIVGRFYTSARRFQQRLGAFPDGSKIPGGPYTYTQIGVMAGVLILGWATMGVWGSGPPLGNFIMLVIVAYGGGLLIGRMPKSRRNILGLASSSLALLSHPGAGGRYKGRPFRLSRKAQKIQREQKNATKKPQANHPASTPDPLQGNLSPEMVKPTGYGSSLNRLLAQHGLLETEGKH